MKILIQIAAFILILLYVFISCKKEKEQVSVPPPPPPVNKPPIANAGTDQSITLPVDSVLLNGNASLDPDGTIISYQWIKISGPSSVAIIKSDSSKTIVKALVVGVYKFELTIKDNGGLSAKDTVEVIVATINQPPNANAGKDLTINLSSCSDRINAELDGSGSTDPDNNIISYFWRKISGPGVPSLKNSNFAKALAENVMAGEYAFELSVSDAGNLTSKDTMLLSVKAALKEYDLDITFNATFKFSNNEKDCYYTPCTYYDESLIEGKATFLPIGEFTLYFSEYTDTANSSYASNSYFSIYRNNIGIYGTCNFNLKKLYQQGGGPFNTTFKVEGGSASDCDANIFKNLAPLTVTGNVDTTARKATVRVQGKTYF